MLASYADNGLLEDERRLIEEHAADCATCLEHLALLGAVSLDRQAPEPSRSWLAQWGWLVPVATAALVVAVWIRLPEQKTSQDLPATPAPASQVSAPVASEQERAATANPAAGRDEASNAAPRVAAKVSKAAPARPGPPADAKFDQLTPLERRDDDARQKTAAASPSPVPAAVAAPAQKEALEGRRAVGQASAQAAPPAPQAPALADAAKEEVQVAELPRRRESDLLKSARATSAPLVVAASPKESYRIVGNRIELSEDGGANWRAVLAAGPMVFTAAGCAAGGPCWFGTADGQVLRRTPDGFARFALPARQRVVAIAVEGPQTAVVTVEGGRRFRTTDGGASWAPIP